MGGGDTYFFPFAGELFRVAEIDDNTLCRVDENGQLVTLLEMPSARNETMICTTEKEMFVSVQRHAVYGKVLIWDNDYYENDTLSGTYRIDAETWSVQKISDRASAVTSINGSELYTWLDGKLYKVSPTGDLELIIEW